MLSPCPTLSPTNDIHALSGRKRPNSSPKHVIWRNIVGWQKRFERISSLGKSKVGTWRKFTGPKIGTWRKEYRHLAKGGKRAPHSHKALCAFGPSIKEL
jgi:hypothetical protein